ncbi:MAG: 16S rRNA (cytosine(1402)-N(4))-methyltransferase RsmH [Planctomycetota bacterium]
MGEALGHIPIMPEETLELLAPAAGETYADLTAGLGGHASAVASRLGGGGRVVLCDLDPGNLRRAEAAVRRALRPEEPEAADVVAYHGSFVGLPDRMIGQGVRADCVLADLGFASNQVDDPARGLSFRSDGPLDMRLDPTSGATAAELVASLPEDRLAKIIFEYGEERASRRVARRIVEARAREPITTTKQLADIARAAVGPPRAPRRPGVKVIDSATRTFQALRIAVNDELGALEALLGSIRESVERIARGQEQRSWLHAGARVGIMSFHSLEDRLVKRAFAGLAEDGLGERVTRKPAVAGEVERERNPRSRSAKLRVVRVGDPRYN